MKNLFSIAVIAFVFAVTSCSKEAKLNRKIDGEWNVVKVHGEALQPGTYYTFKFEKDKKGTGVVTTSYTKPDYSSVTQGTYTLTEDNVIAMILTYDGNTNTYAYIVNDYSKKSLILTDDSGIIFELEKKE